MTADAEVFDLAPLIAESRQRDGFAFRVGEESFSLPAPESLPLEVASLVDTSSPVAALRLLLGDDTARFLACEPTVGAVGALLAAWQRHFGMAPGESPASPQS